MRAIIVEDVEEMRQALERRLAMSFPDIQIVGMAESVVQGARAVKALSPDLVFLDIELPDGTGFDLLDIIEQPVKVIFTTGSDEHAIRAFRYAAIDYLLKPFTNDELVEAVDRASKTSPLETEQKGILSEAMKGSAPKRIALHTSDKIIFVDVKDIVRCEADGNYTHVHVLGKPVVLVARTLKDYDTMLNDKGFFRVHQSHLVNILAVSEFVKTDGGYLVLKNGTKVPVSTRKRQSVLEWLERKS
jgi:two-component system LytT family response regulator